MPRSQIFFLSSNEDYSERYLSEMLTRLDDHLDDKTDVLSDVWKYSIKTSARECIKGFNKYKHIFREHKCKLTIFFLLDENELGFKIYAPKGIDLFIAIQLAVINETWFEKLVTGFIENFNKAKINSIQ